MAQPYAGTDHGMHFPLHKGTEVLLTFVDGDPDRPIVNAAVPNPETPNQVTSGDQTMSKITTSGGNKIHMEDEEGKQRILLHTPTAGTFLRMGAPNDPDTYSEWKEEDGFACHTKGNVEVGAVNVNINVIGAEAKVVEGESFGLVVGFKQSIVLGNNTACVLGGDQKFQFPHEWIISPAKTALHEAKTEINVTITRLATDTNDLAEQTTHLAGNTMLMAGTMTTLAEQTTKLATDVTNLSGNVTKLIGDVTEVKGDNTVIKGTGTVLTAERTNLTTESITLSGVETSLSGEKTFLADNSVELTEISTELTALKNIM
jgi:type VI secretion system secreted protein VgrG